MRSLSNTLVTATASFAAVLDPIFGMSNDQLTRMLRQLQGYETPARIPVFRDMDLAAGEENSIDGASKRLRFTIRLRAAGDLCMLARHSHFLCVHCYSTVSSFLLWQVRRRRCLLFLLSVGCP